MQRSQSRKNDHGVCDQAPQDIDHVVYHKGYLLSLISGYNKKISSNGQITVPVEIRHQLGLKSGDKILFYQNPNGEIVIDNASAQAIFKAQKAFEGVAEQMGVHDEDDVQALVDEVRY